MKFLLSGVGSVCLILALLVSPAEAATFTVTNAADAGPGSLRQAILDSNASFANGVNTIAFNIPGIGVRRILLTSDVLPQIVEPVIIDGYTQPGSSVNTASNAFNGVLRVRLDGILLGYGGALDITAGNSTVRGLNIMNFAGAAVACSGAAAAAPSAHHQPYRQPRAHHHMALRASQLRSRRRHKSARGRRLDGGFRRGHRQRLHSDVLGDERRALPLLPSALPLTGTMQRERGMPHAKGANDANDAKKFAFCGAEFVHRIVFFLTDQNFRVRLCLRVLRALGVRLQLHGLG